ncbi:MAG: hypothetical protein A2Y10_13390 [Planctomycetes bacterium GWF2_41_51]|nr:MAG: hypothetical protein A2Y10_13390 [Planctomycetes bacterium GWF2_41_51]HBG26272.1 hypothetical protein [Phycisphaerales bacterium]
MEVEIAGKTYFEAKGPELVHVQVVKHLKKTIAQMKHGQQLPPERELSEVLKVARSTIRRAIDNLEEEGYLIRHERRGTFVNNVFHVGAEKSLQTKVVGLVVPDIEIAYHARILKGVEEEALRSGHEVIVCNSLLDKERELDAIGRLANRGIGGLLVLPCLPDISLSQEKRQELADKFDLTLKNLQAEGVRVVMLDKYFPNLGLPTVMTNKVQMGYLATEHLIMLGHQKICYVSDDNLSMEAQSAVVGYKRALVDYNIPFDESLLVRLPVFDSLKPTRSIIKRMLTANPRAFTAVATSHFSMTCGILQGLEDAGLNAPDDIAVVGSDTFNNPSIDHITHIERSVHQIGCEAVKLLFANEAESMKKHILLPAKLVIGDTCGANRKK